jgi:ribonuclease R
LPRKGASKNTKSSSEEIIEGRVIAHRDGFGFLHPDEGGDDLHLSPMQMRLCMDGDRVLARLGGLDRRGRREAVVVEVLERRNEQIVGRYFRESGVGFVGPDNPRFTQDILIPETGELAVRHGQFVVVEIIVHPTLRIQAQGRIVEVIGDHMAPGMEMTRRFSFMTAPRQRPLRLPVTILRMCWAD